VAQRSCWGRALNIIASIDPVRLDRSAQTHDKTAVISQQLCEFGLSVLEVRSAVSHSDTWADLSQIAQGLAPAAHDSLFAGSILFESDRMALCVRTTQERLDPHL
jgi:hypothetical protein